ncbi:trehalose-phosphatase [Bordetella sp. BOR01]|uniref:trehalose-phosphatase n=1 Tax=Bordetella sp. BOR01 TaxID=2854779 RepID=UPI001C46C10F|nr:trehalose-phosphatase [Bordetella sp. BOR01]MBV7484750.1 trehalose-phosphatase [Bordetella sp. BOR01]
MHKETDAFLPQPAALRGDGQQPAVPHPDRIALFLDLDGTLAEIQADPDLVSVPPDTIGILRQLYQVLGGALAILSGRPGIDLDRLLHPLALPYAAGHGAERRDRCGILIQAPAPPSLGLARAQLRQRVADWQGVWIEPKGHGLAVHFRGAPRMAARVESAVRETAARHAPAFDVQPGKMVFELRPHGIDKGTALRAFMRDAPFAGRTPVMVGDDLTDEAAFIAAAQDGGHAIKIGAGPSTALWRLDSPHALACWLQQLSRAGLESPPAAATTTQEPS